MSLGETLRQQEELRQRGATLEVTLADKRAALKLQALQSAAHFFFEEVKLNVEEAAGARKPIQGLKVPDQFTVYKNVRPNARGGSGYEYVLFEGCDSQVREFAKWCASNGLTHRFEYEHDGVGVKSWYSVYVAPI